MSQNSSNKSFSKRLLPLLVSQTLGVYNDNAFKALLVFIAIDYAKSYSENSFFLALMTVVFVAPFIIFTVPAGFCSDKFSKKKVLISSKFAETLIMFFGAILLSLIHQISIYPLVVILFLMAGQSAFYSPALNSCLPETFSEKEISRANGILVMLNFVAVIIGFASGIILKTLTTPHYYLCGIFFTVIGLIGFIFSLFIIKTTPLKQQAEWNNNVLKEFFINFKLSFKNKSVFISMMGEAFFYAIGSSLQTVIILFARFSLNMNSDLDIGLLQIVMAVGIAIGCFVAGKLSRDKLELGLVPIGAIGMFIFVAFTVAFHGPYLHIVLGSTVFAFYPNVLFTLTMAGVCGGIFVLPLKVCQQERTKENERGRILAISNFCTFFTIFISGVITYVLTGKSDFTDDITNKLIVSVNNLMLNLSPETVLYIISFSLLAVCVFMVFIHREFLYRAVAVILTRSVYNIECVNLEKLPEKGPAIIVANHVTLIDPFLITSCFSRQITFVMHKNFDEHPIFKRFFKSCKFIPFPDPESPNEYKQTCEIIKNVLKREEFVCVFPEKDITRDGMLGRFTDINYKDYAPEGQDVPLIPIYVGNLWGSIFSYYFRETATIAVPQKLFSQIPITFGDKLPLNIKPYQLKQHFAELTADLYTTRQLTDENTIHYHFMKAAKSHPLAKLITEFGGKSLPSISLLARSLILSKEIRKLNDENKFIGMMLPNCNAAAITTLAILFADKVPAILNFTLPKESLLSASKQANLNTIITSKQFVLRLRIDNLQNVIFLEDLASEIDKKNIYKTFLTTVFLPSHVLAKKFAPESSLNIFGTAALLFSSGSSGEPKGIKLSHHNINADLFFLARMLACKKGDKIVGNLPLFHSFGLIACFWMPLMLGLPVVYIKNPLEIRTIIEAIHKYKLTIFMGTPTFLQGYMKKLSRKMSRSLRFVVSGAEKLRPEIAEEFYRKFKLYPTEGYGCTELSPAVAVNIPESIADLGKKIGKQGSIGRPMPGIAVKVIDVNTHEILPPDTEGLFLVKGPNVMQGYLDEEKTKEVIQDGWYNTGDMATIDENGYITITGRLSRFSKIGGEMVSHQYIENSIHKVLDAQERQVAVAGTKDKSKGEKLLVFYVSDDLPIDNILSGLKKEGVTNIAIPKKENFIKIDEFPLLGTGKLDLSRINKYASGFSN